MSQAKIVVVGGSAAGIAAAVTARRHHPDHSIRLVRKEPQVPVPCGIPYVFGTLGDVSKNLLPDAILEKNEVDLEIAEVTGIDRAGARLITRDGHIEYERLILATGAVAARPPIPGADLDGVFAVDKDVEVIRRLQGRLEKAKDVVIIGGGFIGIELADEINKNEGKKVTVVEMAEHCLSLSYDAEFCTEMEDLVRARGVTVRTSTKVEGIEGKERVEGVRIEGGTIIPADVVILGVGAKANSALARDADLRIGPTGGIAVDRAMRTSDPKIFACGDCAEKTSFFGGVPSQLKLASIAQLEARIAGANLYSLKRESQGTRGVWSTAVGPLAMGTAGLTECMAREQGYQIVCGVVEAPDRHPGAMPGMANMKVKLVFDAYSGVLLGGQVRGGPSAGEMSNAIAACVQKKMTAEDIAMFQMGTHPALTSSPIAYPLVNAAEIAISRMR